MSELGSGVLEGHILPWGTLRTIGGFSESVVGFVTLSGIVGCLGFCASLATNWGDVTLDTAFVTHSRPMWACLTFRMGVFATSNALTLLL